MKYECKAVGRILLPLYGGWIIVAMLMAFTLNTRIAGLSSLLYGFFTAAAVVITALILIQRFYKNLLGNEGYFMFALPVTTGKHVMNKIFSASIWTAMGCIAACLTGFVIILGDTSTVAGIFNELATLFHEIANVWSARLLLVIIECIILALIVFAETAAKVYAAIAAGHQWGNHRVLGAIGAYIGFGILEGILVNIVGALFGDTGFYRLVEQGFGAYGDFASFQFSLLAVALAIGALLAVYWFVTWILLDRKLNLE